MKDADNKDKKNSNSEEIIDIGGVTMDNKAYKPLNMKMLNSKKSTIVSSQDALKDITPINWSEDVVLGRKKITVSVNK